MDVKSCCRECGSISEDASVVDVAKWLRENGERRVFVVDSNKTPVGIISVSDITNQVVAEERSPSELKAKEIMNDSIVIVYDHDDAKSVAIEMEKQQKFSCPVINDKKEMIGAVEYEFVLQKMIESKKA